MMPRQASSRYASNQRQSTFCSICQANFSRKSQLNYHNALVHENSGDYQCERCDKAFPFKSQLESHRLAHSTKRPFQCDLCLKSFKQKAHLNRHRESHSKASSKMWTTKTSDRPANDEVDDGDYFGGSIDYKMGTARSERDLHRRTDGRLSTQQSVAGTSDSEERRVITSSGLVIVYGVEYRPTDSHDENDP